MLNREAWCVGADGVLSTEVPGFRLTVSKVGSWVRYVILQHAHCAGRPSDIMLSSGIAPDVEAAIVAVQKVAARIDFMLAERSRLVVQAADRISSAQR